MLSINPSQFSRSQLILTVYVGQKYHLHSTCLIRFCEILASTYGTDGPGPHGLGLFIILKIFLKSNMLQDHYLKSILLQEHRPIANMLLEKGAFKIWSWSIFDLENSFRFKFYL